jgi:hypothetical protein
MSAIENDFVLLVEVFFRLGPALPSELVTCGHRIRIRLIKGFKGQKREKTLSRKAGGGAFIFPVLPEYQGTLRFLEGNQFHPRMAAEPPLGSLFSDGYEGVPSIYAPQPAPRATTRQGG